MNHSWSRSICGFSCIGRFGGAILACFPSRCYDWCIHFFSRLETVVVAMFSMPRETLVDSSSPGDRRCSWTPRKIQWRGTALLNHAGKYVVETSVHSDEAGLLLRLSGSATEIVARNIKRPTALTSFSSSSQTSRPTTVIYSQWLL